MMENISQERRKTWHTLIEIKVQQKSWSTIRKLRGDPKAPPQQIKVTADQVASQLLQNGKSGKMKNKNTLDRRQNREDPGHTRPMNMEELEKGITSLKPGKAISLDNISTKQIMNFGPATKQ